MVFLIVNLVVSKYLPHLQVRLTGDGGVLCLLCNMQNSFLAYLVRNIFAASMHSLQIDVLKIRAVMP